MVGYRRSRSRRRRTDKYGLTQAKVAAFTHKDILLKGKVLVLDPSCISTSSLPGWAEFLCGELVDAGVIDGISPGRPLAERLQFLHNQITENFDTDLLIIEAITSGGQKNMDSTLQARGVMIGAVNTDKIISISPKAWQTWVKQHYKEWKKDDHEDAIAMGKCIIGLVNE